MRVDGTGDSLSELYVWLDERLQQLSAMQQDQHARIRNDMTVGFSGINNRLDALNGKTSLHGQELAVLRDRSDRSERQAGVTGAITGGVVSGVVLAVKALFTK